MSERVFQWKIMSSHKARPNHSSTKFQTFKLSYTNIILRKYINESNIWSTSDFNKTHKLKEYIPKM